MTKVRNLLERQGRYFARLAVPEAVRSIIGKRELLEPLGGDRRQALNQLPSVIAGFKAQIEAARDHVAKGKPPAAGKRLPLHEIAKAHYRAELERDERIRDHGLIEPGMQSLRPKYAERLRRVAAGLAGTEEIEATIGWAVEQYASNHDAPLPKGSPERSKLARLLAQVQLEANTRMEERDDGEFSGAPHLPVLTSSPPKPVEKPIDPLETRRIHKDGARTPSELLPTFLKERSVSSAVNSEYVVAVRMLEQNLDPDTPVYRIVRRDAINFKNVLKDVPAHATKRFPGKTMKEAIQANRLRKEPIAPMTAQTINAKWLSRLHSFFGWMVTNEIIPDNPFADVRVDAKKKETTTPRTEFAPGDLTKLFRGVHFPKEGEWGEDAWAMLIALFAGLRPSESAQLQLDSIRHERGVLCFVVEERMKTTSSRRFVPVHSKLIELGIEKRIADLRKAGETHFFPRWYADGMTARARDLAKAEEIEGVSLTRLNEYFPRFIPKRFNVTYRKKCGITDPKKIFYSFRHTFKTGLARAGVDKATRDELCGHDDESAGAVYVHDVSIEGLSAAVEKLKFDGFIL